MDKAPPAGPLPPPESKAVEVRRMFSAIAGRYDLLNHLLSANRDKAWRRAAVDALLQGRLRSAPPRGQFADGPIVLDSCAGTLDMSVELARRAEFAGGTVLGFDFTYNMLARGTRKLRGLRILPACADAMDLPLADASVDGAMVAFGVRNVSDLDRCIAEFARVIRPGGRLVILEFTTPQWQPFRSLYLGYFRHVLPFVGRMVSKHGSAYDYLPASVLAFPEPAELAARMTSAGFTAVTWRALTGGIVAVHAGTR